MEADNGGVEVHVCLDCDRVGDVLWEAEAVGEEHEGAG